MAKLLAFCGSSRAASFNQRALDRLTAAAEARDAEVTRVDLGELALPIYNADLEARDGLPEGARRFRTQLAANAGLLVGCPEYNGFLTPLLVNAIDWATRSDEGRPDLAPFANKVVAISSASPGGFGGTRSAGHLRTLLSGIGCIVLPQTLVVPNAGNAFDDAGEFTSDAFDKRAAQVADKIVEVVGKLAP